MAAAATSQPRPPDGRAPVDVLVADGPGRRSPVWPAAALLVALLLGTTVVDREPAPAPPVLALRAGELVARDRTIDARLAEAGMHVEVVNTGDRTLELRRAALVPGAWAAELVDRPLLVPGESAVLSLHRTVRCDEPGSYGPAPEHLVLEAAADDGDVVLVRLPVADPSAYGGRLGEALGDPGRACVVTGGGAGGAIGDLVSSWRARRAWPPVPGG